MTCAHINEWLVAGTFGNIQESSGTEDILEDLGFENPSIGKLDSYPRVGKSNLSRHVLFWAMRRKIVGIEGIG